LRKEVQSKRDQEQKGSPEHRAFDTLQNILKIIANVASYGIFIEVKTKDEKCFADAYGLEHLRAQASKKENFGDFFHPIISTILTSGARLLLAMAEAWLTKHEGYYAFCDTDSIAVSPFHWKKLQEFFEPLNPFREGEFLKIEDENYDDETGQLRELWFYGISAKRYVLFTYKDGEPVPIDDGWSSHGLGHLAIENKEEWEKRLWTDILRCAYGRISKEQLVEPYRGEYAVAKLTLTKPHLLLRVKGVNRQKSKTKWIGPYSFVSVGSPTTSNRNGKPIVPLTPYTRPYDLAPHQPFTDANTGKLHKEHTELYWKTVDVMIGEYIDHPESKFENGHRCGRMRRRRLTIGSTIYIGKESNELEEMQILGLFNEAYVEYRKKYDSMNTSAC